MAARLILEGEELDKQYSPSKWSKRLPSDVIVDHHIKHLETATAHAQKVLRCELGVCYDGGSGQCLDTYYPQGQNGEDGDPAGLLLYIHGGNWCALGLKDSGFLAESCSSKGIATVAVGYDLAPKGTMTTIVQQCRTACAYVIKRFPHSKVFVCGHSAGAHLAACLLYTDWSKYGLPPSPAPLAGAVLLSGMYDLAPIRQSCVNDSLKLTEEEVLEWSPQKNLELIRERLPSQFPCMMAMGKYESDEYHRQGEEFHKGLLSVGVASTYSIFPEDHFSILELLTDTSNGFTQTFLDFLLNFHVP